MTPPRSPCHECPDHPCKEPKSCEARWQYLTSLGTDGMKAVDMDSSYRLLAK